MNKLDIKKERILEELNRLKGKISTVKYDILKDMIINSNEVSITRFENIKNEVDFIEYLEKGIDKSEEEVSSNKSMIIELLTNDDAMDKAAELMLEEDLENEIKAENYVDGKREEVDVDEYDHFFDEADTITDEDLEEEEFDEFFSDADDDEDEEDTDDEDEDSENVEDNEDSDFSDFFDEEDASDDEDEESSDEKGISDSDFSDFFGDEEDVEINNNNTKRSYNTNSSKKKEVKFEKESTQKTYDILKKIAGMFR